MLVIVIIKKEKSLIISDSANKHVGTWMLQSGRRIDNKGGAVAAKPIGRGASIVFCISAAEENNFCSSAVSCK